MSKTDAVMTNNTGINFDDIFNESNSYATKGNKKTQKQPKIKHKQKMPKIPQIEPLEIVEQKQNMIHIIQKYQSSEVFGKFVRTELKISYTEEALQKKTVEQLHTILTKIRVNLDNKNLSKMYDSVLFSSTMMLETISRPVVNVDGFNQLLKENEQFKNCWERFKCESVMPTIPAHLQMIFILGQTYFTAYAMNKLKNPSPEVKQIIDDVKREVDEEFAQRKKEEEKLKNEAPVPPQQLSAGMDI